MATITKNFIDLKPKIWQQLFHIYTEAVSSSHTPTEIASFIKDYLVSIGFDSDISDRIAALSVKTFEAQSSQEENTQEGEGEEDEAFLYLSDIQALSRLLADTKETDPRIASLLTSLLIYHRLNPHPSNWIRYERKIIFYLSSLSKLKTSCQEALTSRLHTHYGFNMQVVGSTQPIPCFKIDWILTDPSSLGDDHDNPKVFLGPLSPQTIQTFVKEVFPHAKR